MLHHGRQRHLERLCQFRHRDRGAFAQLREQRAPRRIGERRESAVERRVRIVNHEVKYRAAPSAVKDGADLCNLLRIARQDKRMSSVSVAAAMTGASAASTQMALAAKMMRMNADAEASVANLLDSAQQNLQQITDAGPGLGQNLDIHV